MSLRFWCLLMAIWFPSIANSAVTMNVREYGAKGDGVALDSPAINATIAAVAQAGGGTLVLPAGTYLCFSIHLKSNITLQLDKGAVLLAATPTEGVGAYDPPEPNEWGEQKQYQDFGHSHWQNSLIWGENLENIAITGSGLIDGTKGLVRNAGYGRAQFAGPNGTLPSDPKTSTSPATPIPPLRSPVGLGNKAIGLKNCRGVTLRDFSVLNGGHFAVLATGVDDLTLENLTVDTNRDGFDIDACRNVRVNNCRVNSPNDDAIVLKSSFALGALRATENVTITNCAVSGFDVGTMLDGKRLRTQERAPDRDGPTGRIKIGTETNGAVRNITISDCIFERSRGLALESVDGSIIEDITVKNITMKEVTNPPVFIRLGNRARGPEGTPVGIIRRVNISHLTAENADARYGAVLICGLPDHPVEAITLSDIRIVSRGGLTAEVVAQQPAELVNAFFLRGAPEPGMTGPRDPLVVPLREKAYPEPSMFGLLPAGALYARHVKNLTVRQVSVSFAQADTRPRVVLDQVIGAKFEQLDVVPAAATPTFVLLSVGDFSITGSFGIPDTHHNSADHLSF